jgi:MarR family transcriptional regulator, organic hydroperoxide resistance regulator
MEDIAKGIQVVRSLKQVMDIIKQNSECQFKEMGMTRPQGMLMGTLAHHGKMKISELSERLELSNSTVSGILDRLEKHSLIVRTRSESDRRVVFVEVSPESKKIFEQRLGEIEKVIAGKLSKADTEDLDKILEGLSLLKKIMT